VGASGPFFIEDWQINHKLNISVIPSWDRRGTSTIDYLSKMAKLATLGEKMSCSLGNIAPSHFTDRAESWWYSLPEIDREYFSQDWATLLYALREQFLTEKWRRDRMREFEEMYFRCGAGHGEEFPLDYLQRRAKYHVFLFPSELNGPAVVARLLRNQPVAWNSTLNERVCESIFKLMYKASHNSTTLMSLYELHRQVGLLNRNGTAGKVGEGSGNGGGNGGQGHFFR
jgi:hypothetical protein